MIGNFRIDLYSNAGVRLNLKPIMSTRQVTRRQALDRYSNWQFDMSTSDAALGHIEGKDFDVWWQFRGNTTYLGRCSYLNHSIQASGDGPRVQVQATGSLRDLVRQTVLQRSFDGASYDINDVLEIIVPLRAGWALGEVDTIAKPAPLDFWYENIFESVALLAGTFGKHFREGVVAKTLDFGAFGESSGIMAFKAEHNHPDLYAEPSRCLIQQVSVAYQGDQVINRLIPFGGAVGVATIDLSETTSTQTGYDVQSAALPGGGSYYYIEDADSIALYGLTERRFLRKDLRPISNSPAAREFAANVLYEAALASLLNLKDRQTIYDLQVTGLTPNALRPGDKIQVLYRGWADTDQGGQQWLTLDSPTAPGQGLAFYVLELNETFGDGVQAQLTINENAVKQERIEDILASTIKSFEQSQIHVQPTISRYTVGPYTKRVKAAPSAVSATYSFKLGPETLNIWYVTITVTGEPLKSSITSSGAGSAHSHTLSIGTSGSHTHSVDVGAGGSHTHSVNVGTGGSHSHSVDVGAGGSHTHTITVYGGAAPGVSLEVRWDLDNSRFHLPGAGSGEDEGYTAASATHSHPGQTAASATHSHPGETAASATHSHPGETAASATHSHAGVATDSESSHTHGLTYGIFEDTVRPDSLTIKVNGTTIATGVTLSAGNNYTYEEDITSYILAAATLQQEHTITVEAGADRGEIQFQAQVLAVIQGIEV